MRSTISKKSPAWMCISAIRKIRLSPNCKSLRASTLFPFSNVTVKNKLLLSSCIIRWGLRSVIKSLRSILPSPFRRWRICRSSFHRTRLKNGRRPICWQPCLQNRIWNRRDSMSYSCRAMCLPFCFPNVYPYRCSPMRRCRRSVRCSKKKSTTIIFWKNCAMQIREKRFR